MPKNRSMAASGNILIVAGIILIVFGLVFANARPQGDHTPSGRLGPLGRLPGDISVERQNWSFHFPVVTSIILSIVLTLILSLFRG